MSLLLQISDPHFGTERPQVVEALLALAQQQQPTLVVLSGDITQRATRREFDAARAFVKRLPPVPLLAIPGNHDVPLFNLVARAFDPYRGFRRVFGHKLEPRFESPQWLVQGVDCTRRWRHKDGELSRRQIDSVAAALRQASAAQLRVVVVHQPPAVQRAQDEGDLLRGAEVALRHWAAAGADIVLGGHIHLPYVLPMHERWPELPRRLWVVQAGTAVSSRLRHEAGNSVNLVRRSVDQPELVCVERWDFGDGRFNQVAVDRLQVQRDA